MQGLADAALHGGEKLRLERGKIDDAVLSIKILMNGSSVDDGQPLEGADHRLMGMTTKHEFEIRVDHKIPQRGNVLKGVAFGIRSQKCFIVGSDSMAEHGATVGGFEIAKRWQASDELSTLGRQLLSCKLFVSKLAVQEPLFVVASHADYVPITEDLTGAIGIPGTVDDVAHAKNGVDLRRFQPIDNGVQDVGKAMDIANDSQSCDIRCFIHLISILERFEQCAKYAAAGLAIALIVHPGMLDLRSVSESLEETKVLLARRGFKDLAMLDNLSVLSEKRLVAIGAVDGLRQERNEASQAMAQIADKKSAEFTAKRESLREFGDKIKVAEVRLGTVEAELEAIVMRLPNLPHVSAPDGLSETDNVEQRVWGKAPKIDFDAKDHVDLGEALGIMDFERAAKVSGSRFVVLKGAGARLERALMQFMLDTHSDEHSYTEIWAPVLVKDTALKGTSQLPKFEKDLFKIAKDADWEKESDAGGHDLYLIPTAEVSITNHRSGEIIEEADLPIAYTGYSACFRSEAGSYGKDTRGMIRQHQFDKVELVRFCHPKLAEKELDLLTGHAEAILRKLGLHYRVVELCAGDMGFAAQKSFDLEVWLPAQNAFREISSCSWFGDFQARRMKIRYRPDGKGKPRLLHTLNGSGLAIGRTLVAILEQNQQEDGSIVIPGALRPYMGGLEVIEKG